MVPTTFNGGDGPVNPEGWLLWDKMPDQIMAEIAGLALVL